MSRLLSVSEVCERALRKIGSFSMADTGARADEMQEAMFWYDMVVGHVASLRRTYWLIPATRNITVTAGVSSYLLRTSVSTSPQVQSMVAVNRVALTGGERSDIPIVRRTEFEERSGLPTTGEPNFVWVDRTRDPTLHIFPAPPTPVTYSLDLTYQTFAPNQVGSSPTTSVDGWRDSWNLFLITRLAAELSDGPVRKHAADEVRALREEAEKLYHELADYDGHEGESPRRVAFNDF